MRRWHEGGEAFWRPWDEEAHPPTKKAADGETDLKRFRIEGVVYARNEERAKDQLDEAGLYLEAANLKEE
jgi:hypothetical protein